MGFEHVPEIGTALRQIEHLPRIEQPLELLHQFDALIAAALRIDKHQHWRHAGRRYRFDDKRARCFVRSGGRHDGQSGGTGCRSIGDALCLFAGALGAVLLVARHLAQR